MRAGLPTGIDIRNGLQTACIGCGACIDACDDVMTKVFAPKGLIRPASLHELSSGHQPTTVDTAILRPVSGSMAAFCFWSWRPPAGRSAPARNPLECHQGSSVMTRQVEQGGENVYSLRLMNASDHERTVVVDVQPPHLGEPHPNPLPSTGASASQLAHGDRSHAQYRSHAAPWRSSPSASTLSH